MHGLGNDYIVIDNRDRRIGGEQIGKWALRLCERRFSVGADGLLLLCDSTVADLKMRIFNSDGSEAEVCGNGLRCLAKYCYEKNIIKKEELRIETLGGIKKTLLAVKNGNVEEVKVCMGIPIFGRSGIPMLGKGSFIDEDLEINGEKYRGTCLSVGNPHCVLFVNDVSNFPVGRIGPLVEKHELFPKRINVEFAQVLNRRELRVRVWERGCGETLACGTGACASAVAGNLIGKVGRKSIVHLLGGDLEVEYSEDIWMAGTAEKVYEGIMF